MCLTHRCTVRLWLELYDFRRELYEAGSELFHERGKITVTAEVENTGKVDGQTVVQMYIRDLAGSVTRPVKELKGFEKVALKAGEKKQVSFTIDEALLAFYGIDMRRKPSRVISRFG